MNNNRDIIIIVDDNITNLSILRHSLAGVYEVFAAPSGEKLFLLLERVTPTLILLDVEMPDMDGYQVMKILRGKKDTEHIPVIFLTAIIDPESEIMGLKLGAADYITKPCSRELLIKRIDLHILCEKQKKELLKYNLSLESEADKRSKRIIDLQNAILKTVAELVDCRDNVAGGHTERTQYYYSLLVNKLLGHGAYTEEVSSWDIELLIMSIQLHDMGKLAIRDEILMKPGKLTEEEFVEMKRHTLYGVEVLNKMKKRTTEKEFLHYAEAVIGSHHERWDGTGYPHGLKGEEIPLQGRVMAIADAYDAMTSNRPYRESKPHKEAVDIITRGRGTHFEPLLVDVFLECEKVFEEVARKQK